MAPAGSSSAVRLVAIASVLLAALVLPAAQAYPHLWTVNMADDWPVAGGLSRVGPGRQQVMMHEASGLLIDASRRRRASMQASTTALRILLTREWRPPMGERCS
jgi:hypothetical protein